LVIFAASKITMTFDVVVAILVILFLVFSLYLEYVRPALVFMIAVAMLLVSGIITPGEALYGFANEQIAIIFLLLLLSDIIKSSGVLNSIINTLFHPRLSYRGFMFRMTSFVAVFSAWVNNTPLVAIMIPYTWTWASKKKIAPSKVLIPLSFAAIVGGMVTLIGTSTNLVVNGLALEASKLNPDIHTLNIFDFTFVGLPLMVIGLIYLWTFGPRLLPNRKDPLKEFEDHKREYLIETVLPVGSTLIGKSVEESVRHLGSLFLAEIIRNKMVIAPVQPNEILQKDDVLIFAGNTETIAELVKNSTDIKLPDYTTAQTPESSELMEVVVSANSGLIGDTVKSTGFRGAYDSAIIAIKRNGVRLSGSIGEQVLRSGDLLLLLAGHDFTQRAKDSNDFYTISRISHIGKPDKKNAYLILGGTILVFLLTAFTSLSLFKGLLVLVIVLALTRIVNFDKIKSSIDAEMFVVLALALAVGRAINNSGAADYIAIGLLDLVSIFDSPLAALFMIYILTNVLSMVVTNKAAVAIVFPIAMAMVMQLRATSQPDLSYTPFILAVAYAGCAEFMTPVGYQTNLMVYGPGGYKFKDYIKVGMPLSILYLVAVVLILGAIYNLY
jgi:di/tricarboxylate transporter